MRKFLFIPCFFIVHLCFSQSALDTAYLNRDFLKAGMFSTDRQYDSAIHYFKKTMALYEKTGNWERQARCHLGLAQVYIATSDYEAAMQDANLAMGIVNKHPEKVMAVRATALTTLGRIYRLKGDYDHSLSSYNEALNVTKVVFSELSPETAACYRGIALAYYYKGDLEKSLEYYQHALSILKRSSTANHNEIASIYTLTGFLYNAMGRYDSSESLCKKAIRFYDKKHPEVSFANTYIGDSYRYRNDFANALVYYQKAWVLIKDNVNQETAVLFNNIGMCHLQLKSYKPAIDNFEKALGIGLKIFGEKHPGLASFYGSIGSSYEALGDLDRAIEYYQRSLVANFISFNDLDPYAQPAEKEYFDRGEILLNLSRKAAAFGKRYQKNNDLKSLVASYDCYKLLDTLISEARARAIDSRDKVLLAAEGATVYQAAIQVSRQLYQITKEPYYYESLFLFSERNKAGVLKESLSEITAKGIGLVPDEMLSVEQDLKAKKSRMKSEIWQLEGQQSPDQGKIEGLKRDYFAYSRKLDSLVNAMEQKYPGYYALKYQDKTTDVSTVQRGLDEKTAMLEYFVGSDSIYAFVITRSRYHVISLPFDFSYSSRIAAFIHSMNRFGTLESRPEEEYNRFVVEGHALYNRFLKLPLELFHNDKEIDHIIVVPDGQLSYLPFDILLMDMPKGKVGDYSSLHYVMNRFTVSYAYSATIMFFNRFHRADNFNTKCISFAPQYSGARPDSLNAIALGKFRDAVSPLKWNQREVEALNKNVDGDWYLANDATEDRFKKDALNYGVIHLAMHALIDYEDPMNSKLVFSKNDEVESDEEDGYLHAFELYNMQLNARMVVLSACNTGYGKLANGEGIMSLGRAFSYAGVPSIVMSHWKVDDEATSQIMALFYQNLSAGMSKGASMRAAKLAYLKNADPSKIHPFYWGAFVNIGDDAPITFRSGSSVAKIIWIGAVGILALAILIIWFRRRQNPALNIN